MSLTYWNLPIFKHMHPWFYQYSQNETKNNIDNREELTSKPYHLSKCRIVRPFGNRTCRWCSDWFLREWYSSAIPNNSILSAGWAGRGLNAYRVERIHIIITRWCYRTFTVSAEAVSFMAMQCGSTSRTNRWHRQPSVSRSSWWHGLSSISRCWRHSLGIWWWQLCQRSTKVCRWIRGETRGICQPSSQLRGSRIATTWPYWGGPPSYRWRCLTTRTSAHPPKSGSWRPGSSCWRFVRWCRRSSWRRRRP